MKLNKKAEKKHLNIAMIGHKRIPSREGGVEIVVEELSTRLAELDHKVTAYSRRGHHISGKEFDTCDKQLSYYKGVKVVTVPTVEKKGVAAVTASFCATVEALFGNYDVIHYHAEGPSAMVWLPHMFGIKTVVTIHGLDWQRAKWGGFATRYLKFGEKVAARYADSVIVLSENVKEYFKKTYGRDTIFIPNGISKPQKRSDELIKQRWNVSENGYILFLGRIVPEKGVKYLINAFKDVETNYKLVIAGGASDTDEFMQELKTLARDDNRIIFTGFVQGQALEELYSNAYVYALPSDLEGMPISLLEAMSYGNCCLVSDIPECTEVVEDKAVVFNRGNVDDLRDKLQMLCDNPEKVKYYKDGASEFICKKYNWDDVVNRTLELYEK